MIRPRPNAPAGPAPGPSLQLTTDAVIASYIHAISDRHRREDKTVEDSADQGPQE
jgi:hypothetical protein